ncbi:MAG: DnaJ domain-containing protein [Chloroflexi bacterium]|nr:DnaJ domain-containing protein [Chloroflexota bacterium]
MVDACSILGIEPAGSSAEVRAAYMQKLREHPPERDPEGFKRVREAYETLRSPRKRAELTLLELRHGPAEFDLDRLRDAPPPPFPERFVDHLIAVLLADVNAAVDAEVARAREVALAASGSPGGAAC